MDARDPELDLESLRVSRAALLERIHARLPDGTAVAGVEALRRMGLALGYRRLVALSRLPGLRSLLDLGYRVVAQNRPCTAAGCARPS